MMYISCIYLIILLSEKLSSAIRLHDCPCDQDVTVVHSFTIVKWEARIVPLLMLVWAVCNMLRVARFKRTTHGDNWKYRYRTVRTGVYNLTI